MREVCWLDLIESEEEYVGFNPLADQIHELRTRDNLSIDELAEKSGISPFTLEGLEAGYYEPFSWELVRLAKVFSISLDDWLLPEEGV